MWDTLGVNRKVQLAELELIHQRNLALALLEQGVTLVDPARIDIRGSLTCGRDVSIDIGCVFEGNVILADGVSIGASAVVRITSLRVPKISNSDQPSFLAGFVDLALTSRTAKPASAGDGRTLTTRETPVPNPTTSPSSPAPDTPPSRS